MPSKHSILTGLLLALAIITPTAAKAASPGKPLQVRLFAGTNGFIADELNTQLEAGGINKLKSIANAGIEFNYAFIPRLLTGIRLDSRWSRQSETTEVSANPQDPYFASLQQSIVSLALRFKIIDSTSFNFDVFGSIGGANTRVDIKTAGGGGTYEKSGTEGAASLVTRAGGSIGVGIANVLLFIEAGQEWNKVSGFKKSGVTSTALNELDMTGHFVVGGILFNGLPSFIKTR